ncbi:MAG: hypothetical protein OEM77_00685 [Nitrosopumilus sp.]|nr:hypothetical protein [Nitrosopumilus sp.]MDH3735944.1 hypothetical protein [Nitrosopumilus sp.]MDH3823631.1 hypothetical protein [Nitrosopumilus sp.]MDH3833841.1 hypothetical protein [Nitrosopumilus sp.]
MKKSIWKKTNKSCLGHKMMSIRCKVCNSSKIANSDQRNSDVNWECQTCGNLIDDDGNIVTSVK